MNNNRQSNNRRRGRNNGNNNRSGSNNRNGFDHQNRIDNRARGNASQMLEKYKKLASDAQHNDDRVNAEYYLQFADHYFRVLADSRVRQEERQEGQQNRRPQYRDDARDNDADELGGIDPHDDDADNTDNAEPDNDTHFGRYDKFAAGGEASAPEKFDTPPKRPSRQRSAGDKTRGRKVMIHDGEQSGLDLSILPPSISISENGGVGMADNMGEARADKPARKPRARKPKAVDEIAAAE